MTLKPKRGLLGSPHFSAERSVLHLAKKFIPSPKVLVKVSYLFPQKPECDKSLVQSYGGDANSLRAVGEVSQGSMNKHTPSESHCPNKKIPGLKTSQVLRLLVQLSNASPFSSEKFKKILSAGKEHSCKQY